MTSPSRSLELMELVEVVTPKSHWVVWKVAAFVPDLFQAVMVTMSSLPSWV
jgi:hypothetical protein